MLTDKEKKGLAEIASAAQIACILEASCEKPGNVTPTKGFSDADYNDYVLGSLAIRQSILEAAERGFCAGKKELALSDAGVGELINKGVLDIRKSHGAGNTHLGILLLLVPLSCAAGFCLAKRKGFIFLREAAKEVIASATKKDAELFYSSVRASGAGGLGELKEKEASFPVLMKMSAKKDRLAEELAGGMPILFGVGLPCFEDCFSASGSVEEALLQTYLLLLSKYPDTLIAKKAGRKEAEKVSAEAGRALSGELQIESFDRMLREKGNLLNPGTTADIVCAVLFLWLLKEKVF